MPVVSVKSQDEYASLKSTSPLLVLDFYATWCGPCKSIGPVFDKLSDKAENAACKFARIDVDQLKSVARECQVTAMPTFIFFKDGVQVDQLKGADPRALETKITKLVSSGSTNTGPTLVKGMISLNSKIDIKQLEILNLDAASVARGLVDPSSTSTVASDSDQQLMIYLPFQESVKVHSIVLRTDPAALASAPAEIQIFANRPNILGFDDVDSIPATQRLASNEIVYDESGQALVGLRYVKFQKVNSLVLFVDQNKEEEEITTLRSIEILGSVESSNSSGVVKKIEEHE